MDQQIFKHFQDVIETTMIVGEVFSKPTADASQKIAAALLAGNTIFSCGEKSGALVAQLFNDYLVYGFELDRPGLVALNLNKLSESSFNVNHFAQSLQVFGKSADVLLVVSPGGNSQALVEALETAIDKNMTVLLISAASDEFLSATVGYNDVHISTAEFSGQLATQAQFQIVQCICALVDHQIFGGE